MRYSSLAPSFFSVRRFLRFLLPSSLTITHDSSPRSSRPRSRSRSRTILPSIAHDSVFSPHSAAPHPGTIGGLHC